MLSKIKTIFTTVLIVLCIVSCQKQTVQTDTPNINYWQLNTSQSQLSFVSTKNKTFTEEHSIQFEQAQIDDQRNFKATIDLNSVDTLIPIRDQRLRDILFETEQYPTATVTAQIPWELDFSVNQNVMMTFKLDLHGHKRTYQAPVVIQMVNKQLVVINYEPILVNAKHFDLDDAINQLTKIAGLQSINYGVLVDFKLTFNAN